MPKTILIVDDLYPNRYLVEEVLDGYTVHGVADGDAMREILKTITPDLIIMDINLPEQDGFELTKELKSYSLTKNIPVIFLTVHNTKTDVMNAVKSGGVDFITKPFDEKDLKERIEIALRKKNAEGI